jgi:hypothetical protein
MTAVATRRRKSGELTASRPAWRQICLGQALHSSFHMTPSIWTEYLFCLHAITCGMGGGENIVLVTFASDRLLILQQF